MVNTHRLCSLLCFAGLFLVGCARSTSVPDGGAALGTVENSRGHFGQHRRQATDAASEFTPAGAVFPRLTAQQYINAVEDIFGVKLDDIVLEADTNPYLFYSVGATSTQVSENGVELYVKQLMRMTDHLFEDAGRREALLGCVPSSATDECARGIIEHYGRRLYRRSLQTDELERWLSISAELGAANPLDGLRLAIAGMLQSPHFLYRVELGERDPARRNYNRYTSVEMASRLSFLLWNSTPDDQLIHVAEQGDLVDPVKLRQETLRILAKPRSRIAIQDFFSHT